MFLDSQNPINLKQEQSDQNDKQLESAGKIIRYETKAYRDRRKANGQRVWCQCSLILPNLDPLMHHKVQATGQMQLNLGGCCLYLDLPLPIDSIKRIFPDSRLVQLKDLVLTRADSPTVKIATISSRRLRLQTDEIGQGIVLRFVNLNEMQSEFLFSALENYSDLE